MHKKKKKTPNSKLIQPNLINICQFQIIGWSELRSKGKIVLLYGCIAIEKNEEQ
jgi:hypothetical protein